MIAANRLQWLDGQMAGKDYICGKRFTLADILLYGWLDFAGTVGQPLDQANSEYRGMDGAGCGAAVGEGVEAQPSFRGERSIEPVNCLGRFRVRAMRAPGMTSS